MPIISTGCLSLSVLEEMHRFGGAQFLGQFFQVADDGGSGRDVATGDHVGGIGMRDDVAVPIHDVDDALAHAGIADALEQPVDGDDGGEHAGKLAVGRKRNGNDQRRAIIFSEREGLADEMQALNAGGEGALSAPPTKGILVGVETAGRLSLGLLVDGGDVEDIGIIFDEALQQARELRRVRGIVHILNPAGERENLALAEKLFAEILLELQGFAGERTSDFGLLDALGILQFFFAEAQALGDGKARAA